MRINSKYILREIAGETLLVSLADISAPKRILCLNDLGKTIYNSLVQGKTEGEILAQLLEEYDVSSEELQADITEFLTTLRKYGVILDD